ncbi:NADH-quinone oxidoreductase subunit NuoH [Asticcacaulis taihuensis]|uniref:NADH-quinone oxidoreductase subunit NuoH n=1 Tax=Asticcacaulis taihuensis TaxID=260084 RepID=UPI003F7C0749|nr:NADH-quinone oxidoreductase subunit NuoH [Asticcacaulis sp.]
MDNFWASGWGWTIITVGETLAVIMGVMVSLAFLLWGDRKVWAGVQMRKGPNVVGPFGLMQSFADFFKFLFKEVIIPAGADKAIFLLAPLLTFVIAFLAWAVIPFAPGWVVMNINVGILYLLGISSLGVYGIIMGGWASNSKYPFLGGLRSAAQMVSYEVSIGFIIVTVILLTGSMNLSDIVTHQGGGILNWNFLGGGGQLGLGIIKLPVMFGMMVMFYISALAETNRPPFDLPDAESELVAGYQVEYSSTPYLLFMIGEYANIVLMCAMISILFFGGWEFPVPLPLAHDGLPYILISLLTFIVKVVFWFLMFAIAKAIVPRYRYDQLMRLGWKVFLPLSLVAVIIIAGYRVYGGAL